MKRVVLFFTFFCMLAGFGLAQQRTGNIYGSVADENKAPLPGILVTLSGDLVGKMTTITNNNGNFRFLSLSPGMYTVTAELEGFARLIRKNIRVQVGGNITLNLTLVPKKLEEEVVVSAAPTAIDTKQTSHATNMTREEMQAVPTARDPWAIMELAPGTSMGTVNVGGSESGQQPGFVSRSSGRSSANWNMDGINITDAASTGASPAYYDFDAFEEVQVQTAANDITAFTAGLQINFVTKRGGNKFGGGGRFYFEDKSFQGENTPEGFDPDLVGNSMDGLYDYGANVGGPIIKDKLWFWISGSIQDIRKITLTGDPLVQKLINAELKMNTILGAHRLEGFLTYSESRKDGRLASSSRPLDAYEARYIQRKPKPFIKLQDEFIAGESLFLSAKVSYFGGGFKLSPIGGLGITHYDSSVKRYLEHYQQTDYIRPQYFAQLTGNLFAENFLGSSHEFKFGVEFKRNNIIQDRDKYPQRLYWRDYDAGTARYAYIYRPKDYYDVYVDRLGFYLQDSVTLGRVTLLAALRYDYQTGGSNAIDVGGSSVDWAGEYQLPGVSIDAKKLNFGWNTFSPRLGLIYDIFGTGKTVFKINFGIYGTNLPDDYAADLGNTYGYYYWKWSDDNGDRMVQPDELGSTAPYRKRDYFNDEDPANLFDSALESPLTLDITAGVEHELFEDVAAGVKVIYRKNYRDTWTLDYVEDGADIRRPMPSDWVVGGHIPDEHGGHPWYELTGDLDQSTTPWTEQQPDWYSRYIGFEVNFKKRMSSSSPWMLNGSFTFANWKQFYPTRASYNDPTNHEPVDMYDGHYSGSSQTGTGAVINPRWLAKLGFAVRLPLDINFGGTLSAREGFLTPRYYRVDDGDRNGVTNDAVVRIAPFGTHRLPNFFMLNLRLDRAFKFNNVRVTLSLDLFNVFNANTTLDEEYEVNASNYLQIQQIVSPRIFRLGVRLNF